MVAVVRESEDYPEFVRELTGTWSYPEDEARKLTPDRRAWMAVPVVAVDQSITAVVYLDSSVRDFFTTELMRLIVNGCHGITAYVQEVY